MLIRPTPRWSTSVISVPYRSRVQRPVGKLEFEVPDAEAEWLIANHFATASDAVNDPSRSGASNPTGDASQGEKSDNEGESSQNQLLSWQSAALEFANTAEQDDVAAIDGIPKALAAQIVKARPLDWAGLSRIASERQISVFEKHFTPKPEDEE